MVKRNTTSKYLKKEGERLDAKKASQQPFPATPLQAALYDFWVEFKESGKTFSFSGLPNRVQKKYRDIVQQIRGVYPNTKIWAIGSTVSGGYVDAQSSEDEIQAYQLIKGKKFSDLDVFIEGQYDLEKLKNINVDIIPYKTEESFLID